MEYTRPEWAKQPQPFRLAHTWAKKTLVSRMQQLGMQPNASRDREDLLADMVLALKAQDEKAATKST